MPEAGSKTISLTDDDLKVIEDTPVKDAPSIVEAPPLDDEDIIGQGADELKTQLGRMAQERDAANARAEAEGRQRQEAERRAQEAADRADMAGSRSVEDHRLVIINALSAVEQEIEAAKRDYTLAMQQGEFDKVADLQVAIGDATARRRTLIQGKSEIERRISAGEMQPDTTRREQRSQPQQPQQPDFSRMSRPELVDAWIGSTTPRTANWLRERRQSLIDDTELPKRLEKLHLIAVGNDYVPDTDAYFQFVEEQLEGRQSGGSVPPVSSQPSRRAAQMAAPVSRSVSSSNGPIRREGNKIVLTSAQREYAQVCGMTDEEYAKALLLTDKRGQFTHKASRQ